MSTRGEISRVKKTRGPEFLKYSKIALLDRNNYIRGFRKYVPPKKAFDFYASGRTSYLTTENKPKLKTQQTKSNKIVNNLNSTAFSTFKIGKTFPEVDL